MKELLFGARLTLAGGRTGHRPHADHRARRRARRGGAAARRVAADDPRRARRRANRRATLVPPNDRVPPARGLRAHEFQGEASAGRLLQAERPGADLPPGLPRLPAPGELFVSPALADLLATPDGRRVLAPRLPGTDRRHDRRGRAARAARARVLRGRGRPRRGRAGGRVARFGTTRRRAPLDPALVLLVVIALVALLIPVGVIVGAAVRTGGEDRDRRLAALRLDRRRPADGAADRGR